MSEHMDKRVMIAIGAAALSLLMLIASSVWSGAASSRLEEIKRAHTEMRSVGTELKTLRDKVRILEKRTAASKGKGLVSVAERLAASVGIKNKLASQKSLSSGLNVEKAELAFEKVTLNELTNLLYKAENLPELLIINKVKMAPSFDKPELIMLDMTVSLIKPSGIK